MTVARRNRCMGQQQDRFVEHGVEGYRPHVVTRRLRAQRAAIVGTLLAALSLALTGCGNFFVPPGTTTTTSGSGTSTSTDFAYVANSSSGANYLNGYVVSSGALTAATSSPYNLDYTPTSIAVAPGGSYVYIATDSAISTGDIYGYSIGSGGALTILNSGASLATADVQSMAIAPNGQWLFALDAQADLLNEYAIDTSTGALTFQTSLDLSGASGGVITPYAVEVSPTGDYVACALGTGGAETFALTETSGALTTGATISPLSSAVGIFALASDGSDNLYAAGTAGLQVFSVTSAGVPTQISTYGIGTAPRSVALSPNYDYVYVANQGSSTISAFSNASGTLTALSGSPFPAPTNVGAIGVDSSSTYLLAEGYSSVSGIELYTIGAAGALTESSEAASGSTTTLPVAVGLTP